MVKRSTKIQLEFGKKESIVLLVGLCLRGIIVKDVKIRYIKNCWLQKKTEVDLPTVIAIKCGKEWLFFERVYDSMRTNLMKTKGKDVS